MIAIGWLVLPTLGVLSVGAYQNHFWIPLEDLHLLIPRQFRERLGAISIQRRDW
jgi:hypothetical protein